MNIDELAYWLKKNDLDPDHIDLDALELKLAEDETYAHLQDENKDDLGNYLRERGLLDDGGRGSYYRRDQEDYIDLSDLEDGDDIDLRDLDDIDLGDRDDIKRDLDDLPWPDERDPDDLDGRIRDLEDLIDRLLNQPDHDLLDEMGIDLHAFLHDLDTELGGLRAAQVEALLREEEREEDRLHDEYLREMDRLQDLEDIDE